MPRFFRPASLAAALVLVAGGVGLATADGSKERILVRCRNTGHVHPHRCLVTGENQEGTWMIPLESLRWSEWGGRKAKAEGVEVGSETRWDVKVILFGRMSCKGDAYYRRLWLKSAESGSVLRLSLFCP